MNKNFMFAMFLALTIMISGSVSFAEDITIKGEETDTIGVLDPTVGTVSIVGTSEDITILDGDLSTLGVLDPTSGTVSIVGSENITIENEGIDTTGELELVGGSVSVVGSSEDIPIPGEEIDTTGVSGTVSSTISVSMDSVVVGEVAEKKAVEKRSATANAILAEKGIKVVPTMAKTRKDKALKPKGNK